jgi:hypothetical protein
MQARHPLRCLLVLPAAFIAFAPLPSLAATPASGTWTMTGAMHQARGFHAATILADGRVLIAGGCQDPCNNTDPQPAYAGAELYHPRTGSWASTGSMHEPRVQYTATLLRDGRVLVVGGCRTDICTIVLAGAELYDARTGTWTMTGSLHDARWGDTATLLPDGRVLVAGGAGVCGNGTCPSILASAEIYDPRTGKWTVTGSLHQGRARHTATLLPDGRVLVAGGATDGANAATAGPVAGAELYNPRTGAWTLTGSLHGARADQSATLLPNGLVLVAGGNDGGTAALRAELYHPHTGTWATTGSLHGERDYQTGETATLLRNGLVLVAGNGIDHSGNLIGSAELYHPRSGAWTTTGSLHDPRVGSTATLLTTGQVLIAGGAGAGGILTSSELYHP